MTVFICQLCESFLDITVWFWCFLCMISYLIFSLFHSLLVLSLSLVSLATEVVTVFVFQEPSLLSSLQDNGLTDVMLHALLIKDVSLVAFLLCVLLMSLIPFHTHKSSLICLLSFIASVQFNLLNAGITLRAVCEHIKMCISYHSSLSFMWFKLEVKQFKEIK